MSIASMLVVASALSCTRVDAITTQRSSDEITKNLIYLSPVSPLENTVISDLKPTLKGGGLPWLQRVEVYDVAVPLAEVTPEQAKEAKEFLSSAIELVNTHAIRSPRTYLTPQEEEVLERSLLNAAHIWLSHAGVPHHLYVRREIFWRHPDKLRWSLRILPDETCSICREAQSLIRQKAVLLFLPGWNLQHGNKPRKTGDSFGDGFPTISGLHLVVSPVHLSVLSISRIVDPNLEDPDVSIAQAFHESLEKRLEAGKAPILDGIVVGHPMPISADYYSRYLEDWYGWRPSELPREETFASPWDQSNFHISFLSLDNFSLERQLRKAAHSVGSYDSSRLRFFLDEVRDLNDQIMRMLAQLEPALAEGLKFPSRKLMAGEPYQWTSRGVRWVRLSIPSEQFDFISKRRKKGLLRFVLPMLDPDKFGRLLQGAVREGDLKRVILTQMAAIKRTMADHKTLSEWVFQFTRDPVNQPEWYGPDLEQIRKRYIALASW